MADKNAEIKTKKWWRKRTREVLAGLSTEYMDEASAAIVGKVRGMREYEEADTILAYASIGREVRTQGLIAAMLADGKNVCLPVCTDTEAHIMEARAAELPACDAADDVADVSAGPAADPTAALQAGAYGIPEPGADADVIPADRIDMVILPCVTCDAECRRLGHGAGYYDRYLELLRDDCCKAALCYEEALGEDLPTEEHDKLMDAVVTEACIYRK